MIKAELHEINIRVKIYNIKQEKGITYDHKSFVYMSLIKTST